MIRSKTFCLLLTLLVSNPVYSDIEDIDAGAPETLDDQIRQSVTPPQYQDPPPNPPAQGQGPYIYRGYPYPFIYPYGPGGIGNVNPPERPGGLRR